MSDSLPVGLFISINRPCDCEFPTAKNRSAAPGVAPSWARRFHCLARSVGAPWRAAPLGMLKRFSFIFGY